MKISEIIKKAWDGEIVTIDKSEFKSLNLNKNKLKLDEEGIVVKEDESNYIFYRFDNKNRPPIDIKSYDHKYEMPEFTDEVICILKNALNGKSSNILLTGVAGTGKSEFIREVCKIAGYGKIFQVNGRDDMDSSDFFGEKTVVIDPVSKQNHIKFIKGSLYQAFIEGTEVDEEGNQILYNEKGERVYDDSGNPKVIGKPGVFFLDEFAAILPSVFLSVFNRAMEIPRKQGECRTIEISSDAGRVVKSHPGFMMFLAGNTVGKGTENDCMMGYTAQNNLMDDSTLDRISAVYSFGYNIDAERNIAMKKLNDDYDVLCLMKFIKEIRRQWTNGNVETLFSTRTLVQVCDLARIFREIKEDYLTLAIYRCVFSSLREHEISAWNETARLIFDRDILYCHRNNKMFFV